MPARRVPYFDPVDEQMIDDVHDERGGMINDVSEVGRLADPAG